AAPCAARATTRESARAPNTTGRRRAGRPAAAAAPRGRRRRRAGHWGFSVPVRPEGRGQSLPTTSTLHLLAAEILERPHSARAVHRGARRRAMLELEPEGVLVEEFVEELAAERADGEELVGFPIMFEHDRRERLRRRSRHDARAG